MSCIESVHRAQPNGTGFPFADLLACMVWTTKVAKGEAKRERVGRRRGRGRMQLIRRDGAEVQLEECLFGKDRWWCRPGCRKIKTSQSVKVDKRVTIKVFFLLLLLFVTKRKLLFSD
jgi:hypothetical protein